MRNITFRGMDIRGNWHYGNLAVVIAPLPGVSEGTYISNPYGSAYAYEVRPETVGQFTGLRDSNSKLIYEGDIVLTNGDVDDCTVVYRDGAFCLGLTLFEGETFGDFVTIRDAMGQAKKVKKTLEMKIIGNIHQEEA